jgi:hypothetical protein
VVLAFALLQNPLIALGANGHPPSCPGNVEQNPAIIVAAFPGWGNPFS